jgi:hypothetical protein
MLFSQKREACKECGETRFTVVSVVSLPADICKGKLRLLSAAADARPEDCISTATVICTACGSQHQERDFRLAA